MDKGSAKDYEPSGSEPQARSTTRKRPRKPRHENASAFDKLARLVARIPAKEARRLPRDLSENADYYLYGAPKQ